MYKEKYPRGRNKDNPQCNYKMGYCGYGNHCLHTQQVIDIPYTRLYLVICCQCHKAVIYHKSEIEL